MFIEHLLGDTVYLLLVIKSVTDKWQEGWWRLLAPGPLPFVLLFVWAHVLCPSVCWPVLTDFVRSSVRQGSLSLLTCCTFVSCVCIWYFLLFCSCICFPTSSNLWFLFCFVASGVWNLFLKNLLKDSPLWSVSAVVHTGAYPSAHQDRFLSPVCLFGSVKWQAIPWSSVFAEI